MKNYSIIRKGRAGIQSGAGGSFVKIEANSHVDLIVLSSVDDFVSFDQHTIWQDEGNSPIFACIGRDNNCPGCAAGNRAAQKTYISVYDITAKAAKILPAGSNVANAVADCAEEVDIKGRAFRIKRKGSGKNTRYSVIMLNKKANVDKIKSLDVRAAIPLRKRSAIIAMLAEAGIDEDDLVEESSEE